MQKSIVLLKFLDRYQWSTALLLCATIGLAPFTPPHVWEKLQWLVTGHSFRMIDVGDFLMHGLPWLLLFAKSARWLSLRRSQAAPAKN